MVIGSKKKRFIEIIKIYENLLCIYIYILKLHIYVNRRVSKIQQRKEKR